MGDWLSNTVRDETEKELVKCARRLYERGLVSSTGGNVSVRAGDDRVLITPSGRSLGDLEPEELVEIDLSGGAIRGGKPSKEVSMHLAAYRRRPDVRAVIHAHSPYSVCVSCMIRESARREGSVEGEDQAINHLDSMPPFSPGYVIRVGRLPLIPFFVPGSPELAEAVNGAMANHDVFLLQNHGPVALGKALQAALSLIEEVESNAMIFVLLGTAGRSLSASQISRIRERYC